MSNQTSDRGFIVRVWHDEYRGGRWKSFKEKRDNLSQQSGKLVKYEPIGEKTTEVGSGNTDGTVTF